MDPRRGRFADFLRGHRVCRGDLAARSAGWGGPIGPSDGELFLGYRRLGLARNDGVRRLWIWPLRLVALAHGNAALAGHGGRRRPANGFLHRAGVSLDEPVSAAGVGEPGGADLSPGTG